MKTSKKQLQFSTGWFLLLEVEIQVLVTYLGDTGSAKIWYYAYHT